jgi:hypothetical protein
MTNAHRPNRMNRDPRRLTAVAMATAAICAVPLVLGSALPAAQADVGTCPPPGARTLLSDEGARVYSLPSEGPFATPGGKPVRTVYGCLPAAAGPITLGTTLTVPDLPTIDPRTVALSAPWVAYSLTEPGTDSTQADVALRSLATGKLGKRVGAGPYPIGPESFSKVTGIVVDEAGAFAWISTGNSIILPLRAREVAAVDSDGKRQTLDTAVDIDPHSLVLHGRRLSWTDGGTGRSAALR